MVVTGAGGQAPNLSSLPAKLDLKPASAFPSLVFLLERNRQLTTLGWPSSRPPQVLHDKQPWFLSLHLPMATGRGWGWVDMELP